MLGGLTAKIRMKTGDLAGFEFEIDQYDDDTKEIWIIPFKDERGELFPNDTLYIKVGDEYTLVDIDQPETYVAAAEAELEAAAQAYINEHSVPRFPYRVIVDPAFMNANPGGFEIGDRVTVIDTDYDINGLYRISSLIYDTFKQTYEFILSDNAILTHRQRMELRVQAVERSQEATRKDQAEAMRKDVETANELRNRIFDPIDDKFNADRNVRDESIDPRMLAYDTGVPQFSIRNALVETNVDGNEDKVKVNAGHLVMHNWAEYTLDRYGIYKLKQLAIPYDPTRTWIIPETNFTLTTKNGYWIYAKIDLTPESTDCVLEVYEEHKEVKLLVDNNYLMYKLGYISAGEEVA
jgi:hypothetical protein